MGFRSANWRRHSRRVLPSTDKIDEPTVFDSHAERLLTVIDNLPTQGNGISVGAFERKYIDLHFAIGADRRPKFLVVSLGRSGRNRQQDCGDVECRWQPTSS